MYVCNNILNGNKNIKEKEIVVPQIVLLCDQEITNRSLSLFYHRKI
jgi:hypothetical protein